ncbi:hypothetical protein RIdsm_05611 (plasmid) [Roseovarius indicus]|uniref:Uncharacterized protein n=1 Tax=Roseovarius indicus TaxID=540747 RepID=A0A5P3AN95_9RHOB|nr:hypothetical protein [Roseovarius indicus]QEW29765.1 hypothetical protein RIdsm_05611 [Roseovarius indicus]SFE74489.1 hypothetical protein SAMN04488031_1191 [Roseovarius indicus]
MNNGLGHAALKAKQRAIREGFPETMGLRAHRAISWIGVALPFNLRREGVGKTWGSGCCSAVCASQLPIKNGGPHDGNVMRALG